MPRPLGDQVDWAPASAAIGTRWSCPLEASLPHPAALAGRRSYPAPRTMFRENSAGPRTQSASSKKTGCGIMRQPMRY